MEKRNKRKCRLLLDDVARQWHAAIFEVPVIRQGVFLVLDLSLGIRGFGCDGLAGEGPNEDLYSAVETKDKVEYRLLLDVVAQ